MSADAAEAPQEGAFHERVAEEARALLARRQISAREVARLVGWTDNYISRRLTGKIPFDVNDLEMLSRTLGVPVTVFFPQMILQGGGVDQGSNKRQKSTLRTSITTYIVDLDTSSRCPHSDTYALIA